MQDSSYILVLYYSLHGAVRHMAEEIAKGIESVEGMSAKIRTVPKVISVTDHREIKVTKDTTPLVTLEELAGCAGLAMGSPTRYGNMAAPLKYFLDGTIQEWVQGALIGKPASVFTSSSTMHGGQESTLLSMMLPLLHHGMVIVGIPYSEPDLMGTQSGGTPYGASHVTFGKDDALLSTAEKNLCFSVGKRLAKMALKLLR